MSIQKKSAENPFSKAFAGILVPMAYVMALIIYMFILCAKGNFEGADKLPDPTFMERFSGGAFGSAHPSGYLGTIYKGGFIVPILMAMMIIVVAVCIERFLTISMAKGKGDLDTLVRNVQSNLNSGNIDAAIGECNKNKGAVGNVILAGLNKYRLMQADNSMAKDQKVMAIQKEIEEATSLELPMLERNLVLLATITSVGTLVALLGTVLGMIRAFRALANAGSPDAVALSTGISEALINTALGISTSAVAIVFYNIFTSQIDSLTYKIDEAGFSIAQTFAEKH
jgi:biopolymer transport protein ExbB